MASLGDRAGEVLEAFADELQLPVPPVPWHVARYGVREVTYALRQLGAAGERIASEVVRLQATEVAEVREPAMPGHVGSSTMPQKRNPMTSEYLIGSARMLRATLSAVDDSPAHAGERDMGPWASEWISIPQGCILAASVADKLAGVLEGLEVDTARMRANLGLTQGSIMAEAVMMRLGEVIGHEEAHHALWRASREAAQRGIGLDEALAEVEEAQAVDVGALLDPGGYLGWSEPVALAAARRARALAGG
jgi:adenylosuccinate lyase/3-carboxy-cis,cis-muconate cycloisomerase